MTLLFCQHTHADPWLSGIPIDQTPHRAYVQGDQQPYRDYLTCRGHKQVDERCRQFDALIEAIGRDGQQTPVQVVTAPDGRQLLFHGNHRAAVLSPEHLRCTIIPMDEYIHFNALVRKYKFGAPKGIPYQPVLYRGDTLLAGRRADLLERHELIDPADLRGKRVYDFGCNIGSAAVLAHESGASVEGWDLPEFRTAAMRLALLFNYDIRYQRWSGTYDTLFLFSVHAHTEIPDIDARVVYIETHEDGRLPDRWAGAEFRGSVGKRKVYRWQR